MILLFTMSGLLLPYPIGFIWVVTNSITGSLVNKTVSKQDWVLLAFLSVCMSSAVYLVRYCYHFDHHKASCGNMKIAHFAIVKNSDNWPIAYLIFKHKADGRAVKHVCYVFWRASFVELTLFGQWHWWFRTQFYFVPWPQFEADDTTEPATSTLCMSYNHYRSMWPVHIQVHM